jgi:hypothetical protein
MNGEFPENDALWRLLGKASAHPQASPFFARNVLRAIRHSGSHRDGLFPRWIPAAAFAALAAAFTLSLLHSPAPLDPDFAEFFDRATGIDELVPDGEPTLALLVEN